ncbi:MAG TPA: hypothetical protein VKU35_01370 [Candidatus Limnocylindria bacterium]|nr:hypothetical protein [Candidatus Limnocylindria bacterium]
MSGAAPLWESEGDVPFLPCAEDWRGDRHPESDEPGWPEDDAGPEYRFHKRDLDEEDP